MLLIPGSSDLSKKQKKQMDEKKRKLFTVIITFSKNHAQATTLMIRFGAEVTSEVKKSQYRF